MIAPESAFLAPLDIDWNAPSIPSNIHNLLLLLYYAFQGRSLLVGYIMLVAFLADDWARRMIVCGIVCWCIYAAVTFSITGFISFSSTKGAVAGLVIFACLYITFLIIDLVTTGALKKPNAVSLPESSTAQVNQPAAEVSSSPDPAPAP